MIACVPCSAPAIKILLKSRLKTIHPKKLVVGKLKDFIGVDFCYMQTSAPLLFICDDNECAIQGLFGVREKIEEFLVNNSAGRFCDFCQERCEKLHRCSGCFTKEYCGAECRDQDWQLVHKEICGKGEKEDLKRKKKEGGKVRKENIEKRVEKIRSDLQALPVGNGTTRAKQIEQEIRSAIETRQKNKNSQQNKN